MREPPDDVQDARVLAAVRGAWAADAIAVEHLPVGFGAHHWRVVTAAGPGLFATLDRVDGRRGFAELTAAYSAAAELGGRLPFVHACLEPWVVALGDAGALSATPWLDASTPPELDATATAALLDRLHAAPPPAGIRPWRPRVPTTLAVELDARVAAPWLGGPHGVRARDAIADALPSISGWTAEYHRLAAVARRRPWVPTHGEPGIHNQLVVDGRIVLVDWETLLLAPPERDTKDLGTGDERMLDLFDLEWRLDEIAQYAARFAAPHTGGADDDVAIDGLLEELGRPPWPRASMGG